MNAEDKAKLRPPLSFVVFVSALAAATVAAMVKGVVGTIEPMWFACGFLFAIILVPQVASELVRYHRYRPN